jgi:hypothetical protein
MLLIVGAPALGKDSEHFLFKLLSKPTLSRFLMLLSTEILHLAVREYEHGHFTYSR